MSIKVRQALIKCLEKIENDTFDEDTIRTFLIVSRDFIKMDGLIKELAHFIAHPVRDKGIFHKKLNSRYAKFKLAEEQVLKFDITKEFQDKIKTEEDLSDFMLGGVSMEKIESKLFNILYVDGLDDLPENHLKKYTGFSKHEVKKLFSDYYVKKDGFHYLTTNKTERMISMLRSLPDEKTQKETDELHNAEILVKRIKKQIDSVQKVVRGAIYYNSVFETKTLLKEIEITISQVIKQLKIDRRFINVFKEKINDILLCIMTLLHDAKFVFYDKNFARSYLCIYQKPNLERTTNLDTKNDLYNSGVLALYISYSSGKKTIKIPLFVSDLQIKDYLDIKSYETKKTDLNNNEICWITASRLENKLQLTDD